MSHGFPDLAVGGLLIDPFVPQAILAFAVFLLARPLRRRVMVDSVFANPPLADVCLYAVILALVLLVY